VLCSGGPGCCDYLEPVARLFDGKAQTIRFDSRGCGRSSLFETYTLDDSLADLERIRGHYGFERWIVLGHSAGADIALAYALRYRERTRTIICLSGGRIHNDRDWHAAYSEGRDAGREPDLDYAFPPNPDVNRQLNAEWKAFIKQPSLLRDLARLDVPALFVYGSEDIRPRWPMEQLANLLPNAQFHLLQGADHHLWLTHSAELGALLNDFVPRFD
jgi:proline iminopeptidase